MNTLVEPSDAERAEWKQATEDYVAGLEREVERLRGIIARAQACKTLAQVILREADAPKEQK